jgi:hypothetical protein
MILLQPPLIPLLRKEGIKGSEKPFTVHLFYSHTNQVRGIEIKKLIYEEQTNRFSNKRCYDYG